MGQGGICLLVEVWIVGFGKKGWARREVIAMTMAAVPAVQRLYDVCKKVFTSTAVPSEAQVSNVRAVLGILTFYLLYLLKLLIVLSLSRFQRVTFGV